MLVCICTSSRDSVCVHGIVSSQQICYLKQWDSGISSPHAVAGDGNTWASWPQTIQSGGGGMASREIHSLGIALDEMANAIEEKALNKYLKLQKYIQLIRLWGKRHDATGERGRVITKHSSMWWSIHALHVVWDKAAHGNSTKPCFLKPTCIILS